MLKTWCRLRDLNPRPPDYKSSENVGASTAWAANCPRTDRARIGKVGNPLTPTHLALLASLDAQRAHDARRGA